MRHGILNLHSQRNRSTKQDLCCTLECIFSQKHSIFFQSIAEPKRRWEDDLASWKLQLFTGDDEASISWLKNKLLKCWSKYPETLDSYFNKETHLNQNLFPFTDECSAHAGKCRWDGRRLAWLVSLKLNFSFHWMLASASYYQYVWLGKIILIESRFYKCRKRFHFASVPMQERSV